jgi:hypothetical protein
LWRRNAPLFPFAQMCYKWITDPYMLPVCGAVIRLSREIHAS